MAQLTLFLISSLCFNIIAGTAFPTREEKERIFQENKRKIQDCLFTGSDQASKIYSKDCFPKNQCYNEEGLGCFSTESGPGAHLGFLPTPPDELLPADILKSSEEIKFEQIPTRFEITNSGRGITLFSLKQIRNVNPAFFNVAAPVYFITHGFQSSGDWLPRLRDTIRRVSPNANVVTLYWDASGGGIGEGFYKVAAVNTIMVGRMLGLLAARMVEFGMNSTRFHGIGHSLGAHLMGFASNWLLEKSGQRFGKITGMDPAGVDFYDVDAPDDSVLEKNDADFVSIVHTNSKDVSGRIDYGSEKAVGHVDYYVNGGNDQPGCSSVLGTVTRTESICHHGYAYEILINSELENGCRFIGLQSLSWEDFQNGVTSFKEESFKKTGSQPRLGIEPENPGRDVRYIMTREASEESPEEACGRYFRVGFLNVHRSSSKFAPVSKTGVLKFSLTDGENKTKGFVFKDFTMTHLRTYKLVVGPYDMGPIKNITVSFTDVDTITPSRVPEALWWPFKSITVEDINDPDQKLYACKYGIGQGRVLESTLVTLPGTCESRYHSTEPIFTGISESIIPRSHHVPVIGRIDV